MYIKHCMYLVRCECLLESMFLHPPIKYKISYSYITGYETSFRK